MTSTFLTLNHHTDYHATQMSTYGLNYFNDNCSTSDCSDGYQSSISPVASPSLGSQNYFTDQQNYSNSVNYQNQQNSYYQSNHQNDYYMPNSYKLDLQIKPYPIVKTESTTSTSAPPKTPSNHMKVNRFAHQFTQQHENLTKQFLEHQKIPSTTATTITSTAAVTNPPPEILKRRRVAANARERRRMNNLNFAFDR